MDFKIYIASFLLMAAFISCSSSETVTSDEINNNSETQEESQSEERILLNINEAVYFDFFKEDSMWTGELTIYTLNDQNEKVVQSEYVSTQDSSWAEFGLFVDHLRIYSIPPQHEIEGWVPNSSQLPRRVYNFTVSNTDTTRSFSYQDPENQVQRYWQAQHVLTFVTYIQNDLKWVNEE